MGDYAASKRSLKELQHEAAVYEHLRGEQGVSVPRFVACGYIVDSTLYFLATELLGPSLESAGDDLEPAALHALQRVHACGVLHRKGFFGLRWPVAQIDDGPSSALLQI